MTNKEEAKSDIFNLVRKDKLSDAIDALELISCQNNEIIVLKGRLFRIETAYHHEVISFKESSMERTQIASAIIRLIYDL